MAPSCYLNRPLAQPTVRYSTLKSIPMGCARTETVAITVAVRQSPAKSTRGDPEFRSEANDRLVRDPPINGIPLRARQCFRERRQIGRRGMVLLRCFHCRREQRGRIGVMALPPENHTAQTVTQDEI